MVVVCSSSLSVTATTATTNTTTYYCNLFAHTSKPNQKDYTFLNPSIRTHFTKPKRSFSSHHRLLPYSPSKIVPLRCSGLSLMAETAQEVSLIKPIIDYNGLDEELIQKMAYDALLWSSLNGLVSGDRKVQRSGIVPGVGMVHSPFSLLPVTFPESHWKLACEVAPIFNELIDRVSLDGKFLQDSLSRTKKVDDFTSRLLDIHSKMLEMNKTEDIRLGLSRSDYMLDEQTKLLLQIELNTISTSLNALTCLVGKLHRRLLKDYGEHLGLDSQRIPINNAVNHFAEALAEAWIEYNSPRAVVMFAVQPDERNMYDQHWLAVTLKEEHNITVIRKTLKQIDEEGELLPDGRLLVGGQEIALVYFRCGYTPTDYPSEAEWRARLLMEQSLAIKCPTISYHLTGTKKIQQELAKPNVLERFLENKDDIAKLRKCFAGLWSLDDSDIVNRAIERPELFVLKPQREGGGNNFFGDDLRKNLLRFQKERTEADAAYILMQRIFPPIVPTLLVREGKCCREHAVSEICVYAAYLRNKDKVIINDKSGYLIKTKVSSSDEGGIVAGFGVMDSIYLVGPSS